MLLHHFMPAQNVASFRFQRLLRHLPENGVDPIVLSSVTGDELGFENVKIASGVSIPTTRVKGWSPVHAYDSGKKASVPGRTSLEPGAAKPSNSLMRNIKRWVRGLMVPDDHFAFVATWSREGQRLSKGLDVIYSSSSPYSVHLAARSIAGKTGLPWVMEMRDLWADSPYLAARGNPIAKALHLRHERRCLEVATRVVVLTPEHSRRLALRYPNHADKIRVVTNMIDADIDSDMDVERVVDKAIDRTARENSVMQSSQQVGDASREGSKTLRLAYVGSLYGGRDLSPLVRCINRWNDTHDDVKWTMDVAGTSSERPWREVLGESPFVVVHGQLAPTAVRELLASADVGVLHNPVWDEVHIPGKLYDYLGARLPVLNLTSQRDVEDLVGGGVPIATARPDDEASMDEALARLAGMRGRGGAEDAASPGSAHLRALSSCVVAETLAEVFREARSPLAVES